MALHRKLRGPPDALPQYVRLPASRAAPSPVASASTAARHPRKARARLLRAEFTAPRQQIGSLQLRACFLLCVLLYFGTIYFADDIVGLGQALGSEPARSSRDFFVQSGEPVADANVGNLRVAAVGKKDDAGGGEADAAVKEADKGEEDAVEKEDAPLADANDVESPREDLGEAEAPVEVHDDADRAEKMEELPLVPAEAARRERNADERPVIQYPAPMRPQTIVDAVTAREDVHPEDLRPTPEQRRVPSETEEAVGATGEPKHVENQPDEINGHVEEATAADDARAEGKEGDAPPDETDEGAKSPTPEQMAVQEEKEQEQKEQEQKEEEMAEDPSPHEEHR